MSNMNLRATVSLILLLVATTASADLVFSAPPRESAEESRKLYEPLVTELSKILGEKVMFHAPESWAAYSREMQNGDYDLVFDGPHFVAWRMAYKVHVPLVRLEGSLVYTVLGKQDGPATLGDLRARKVCCMTSPNLTAVVLLNQFNSYSAPELYAPRGGMKGSFQAFEEGKCDAVALPSYFFTQVLPREKTANLRTLFTSKPLPNLTLTAGPKVSQKMHESIVKTLTDPKTQEQLKGLLGKLAGKGEGKLIAADPTEFAGHEKMLEGVVWGW
jgi:ABC-type phosphate/phosphonate transport system substrate-binding protein